jgi:hypothetical protein
MTTEDVLFGIYLALRERNALLRAENARGSADDKAEKDCLDEANEFWTALQAHDRDHPR